jgi:hypothetical protein
MDTAEPGIATTKAISNLLLQCPRIQNLSADETDRITDRLEGCNAHFDSFVE